MVYQLLLLLLNDIIIPKDNNETGLWLVLHVFSVAVTNQRLRVDESQWKLLV